MRTHGSDGPSAPLTRTTAEAIVVAPALNSIRDQGTRDLNRLGRYEAAATIAKSAANPFTTATNPEITNAISHLRGVLGDQTYESLARKGETMTTAATTTLKPL
jgi:hypothetical protein